MTQGEKNKLPDINPNTKPKDIRPNTKHVHSVKYKLTQY